jgi:hypothetical protein
MVFVSGSVVHKVSARAVSYISRLKEMGVNHDMKPFSLSNKDFALLNAELNARQLLKCTHCLRN